MNSYEIIDIEQLEAERAAAARRGTFMEVVSGLLIMAFLGLMIFLAVICTDYHWC